MQTIFVDVDTQFDFCDPRGALFVGGSEALLPVFAALTARAVEVGIPIVGSVDSHAFDAWEFAGAATSGPAGERPGFPPHCVKGTRGWLKVDGTLAPRARFVPNVPMTREAIADVVHREQPQQILLEKEVYSLFANPNADMVLDALAAGPVRFVVYGVALDYCVRAAAVGLKEWLRRRVDGDPGRAGSEVVLLRDATASVDPATTSSVLAACQEAGIRLARVADLLADTGRRPEEA